MSHRMDIKIAQDSYSSYQMLYVFYNCIYRSRELIEELVKGIIIGLTIDNADKFDLRIEGALSQIRFGLVDSNFFN